MSQAHSKIRVLIVGAGKGGTAVLKLLYNDPEVEIVGIVDINKDAPGIKLAEQWGIPTSENFQDFFKAKINTIIDVADNEEVAELLRKIKPPEVEIMGGLSAKLMWDLIMERELRLEEKNGMLREKAKQLEQTQLELKVKLEELEKMFRLSLNREIEMSKLKERIRELEKKLENK